MTITKTDNCTTYTCKICGYEHVVNNDGSSTTNPFIKSERKIKISKRKTKHNEMNMGVVFDIIETDGYICPNCNKLQIQTK